MVKFDGRTAVITGGASGMPGVLVIAGYAHLLRPALHILFRGGINAKSESGANRCLRYPPPSGDAHLARAMQPPAAPSADKRSVMVENDREACDESWWSPFFGATACAGIDGTRPRPHLSVLPSLPLRDRQGPWICRRTKSSSTPIQVLRALPGGGSLPVPAFGHLVRSGFDGLA
jgi:hypothetical protein